MAGGKNLTYDITTGRLLTTSMEKISDSRTYDTRGLLQSYSSQYNPMSGPAQMLYSYTLTRDVMGRITGKTETVLGVTDTYVYGFDTAGRLTSVTKNGSSWSTSTYDTNGNRTSGSVNGTSFTATYDDQDRLSTWNGMNYTYNANGELTQAADSLTTTTYTYNALGALKSASLPTGQVITYKQDTTGRRISTLVNGVLDSHFLYEDPYRIAIESDNSGVTSREYIFATSINSPDIVKHSGNRYRVLRDHLGSPRLIVRTTDAQIRSRLDYNEWGKVIGGTNKNFQPYGFAGGIKDAYTGLVRFGARDYDPETGRWTSKDPILFGGGDSNLYAYILSDPINFIDPTGKDAFCLGGNIGTVVALKWDINNLKDQINRLDQLIPPREGSRDGEICPGDSARDKKNRKLRDSLMNDLMQLQNELNFRQRNWLNIPAICGPAGGTDNGA